MYSYAVLQIKLTFKCLLLSITLFTLELCKRFFTLLAFTNI